jgi:hypothetical protein
VWVGAVLVVVAVVSGGIRRSMEEELAMLRQFIGQLVDLFNLYGSPLPPFDSLQFLHFHNQQQNNNNRSLCRSLSFLDFYFFLSVCSVSTMNYHFFLFLNFTSFAT